MSDIRKIINETETKKAKNKKIKKKIRGTGAIAKDQMIKWYN